MSDIMRMVGDSIDRLMNEVETHTPRVKRTRERGPDRAPRKRKPAKGEQPYRATIAFRIDRATADAFREDPDWAEVLRAFVRERVRP